MKPPDLIEVVLKVARVFEKLGIGYEIGRSLASSAFGVPRATLEDADGKAVWRKCQRFNLRDRDPRYRFR